MKHINKLILLVALSFSTPAVVAEDFPADPMDSPQWGVMHQIMMGKEKYVFDDRIKVYAPKVAEDSLNVPVSFRIKGLEDIKEIIVFSDLNPIPKVLRFQPNDVDPYLAFRIKLQQASPVRVAAKTGDGLWHVNSAWVDAAGGGCTLPSIGTSSGDWTTTLGKVSAHLWQNTDKPNRLRVRIMHPMDTGLAPGVPKFHIEQMTLRDESGKQLAYLEVYEPISENPMLSLDVGKHTNFYINGRDNNGNIINAEVKG